VTAETAIAFAVLAALLVLALGAVVVLAVTLPARVARMVAEQAARERTAVARPADNLAAVTAAQRAILVEQQQLAATLHGLAQWLVNVALRGERRTPPKVAGGGRQPDQPPRVQAGRAGCRPPLVTAVDRARVVVFGPWGRREREHVELPEPAPSDGRSLDG
jgi:hypothetical protein